MGNTPESRITSTLYFFKPSLRCVAVFVPFLVFPCFLLLGFSTFLFTICILFVSAIFIVTFSKKKVTLAGNSAKDESSICWPKNLLEKEAVEKLNPEVEPIVHFDASKQNDVCDMHEYQAEATDFPSESDSSDDFSASENSELSWRCSENVGGQSIAVCESSISEDDEEDGDSLIEISLPQNNSVDSNEKSKKKSDSDLPDYLPESILRQQGLMELFAEINDVNEEENLIEIDLSVGSIKCSTFEIEA